MAFPTIPDVMTYLQILPAIFAELQNWLGLAGKPDEYWEFPDEK